MKKKIIICLFSLSIVILIAIIIGKKEPKSIELTTFEKAYNIVQTDDNELIEIPIYINQQDSYLVKKDNISSIIISNLEDSMAFKVDRIIDCNQPTIIKSNQYYMYLFKLAPSIKPENNFNLEMENSTLQINYIQGVNVNINIGSFSYYNYNNCSYNLSLKHLKGLVNTYDDKVLVGVSIGLKNNTKDKISIKNIIPLDTNVRASLDEIVMNKGFEQEEKIDNVLGYVYQLNNISDEHKINIDITSELNLFVPLKYKNDVLLNKLGFLIEYEINGEIDYLCIDDFMFFNTNLHSINKINELKIYTYESY